MKKGLTILAAFLLLAGFSVQASAAKKTTFLLDWIVYGKHAPFFVAQDMGHFKKRGLDMEFRRGFGSGDTVKKIAAKVARIGFADAGSLINGRANSDVKVVEVAMIHAKPIQVVVFLQENNNWKSPRDMVGARLARLSARQRALHFPPWPAPTG